METTEKAKRKKILFLPGLLCDRILWQLQIEKLRAENYTSYVGDLTQDDSVEAMASRALKSIDGDFILCGLSMGGYVAMEIMRQAAERVEKLIIIASSARQDSAEKRVQRQGLVELAQKGRFKGVTPRLLPMLIHESRLSDDQLTKNILDMAERIGLQAFLKQQQAILGRKDSRADLKKIKQETLIICGQQDLVTPPEHAHEMAELLPNAHLIMIDQCGHLPPMEHAVKTNEILKEFIE